jgi:hypothetical protein
MAKSQFLADTLKTFLFSLSQGMGAAAQAPGRRGTNLGMAAALGAPMQLGEMERQRQMQEEDRQQRIEAARAATRRGDIEDAVKILNTLKGSVAPEVQVNAPVATPSPIGTMDGGTFQPPSQGGGTMGVPTPLKPVEIPGYGMAQPQSAQQMAVQKANELRQQAQLEQEMAPPPEPRLFNTPGGTVDQNNPSGGFVPGTTPQAEPGVAPELVMAIVQDPARYHDLPPTLQAAVLPELTKQNIQIPSKPVDPTVQAIRELTLSSARMQQASGGLTPSQVASEVNTLRNTWTKAIEPTLARREAIAKIDTGEAALKAGNRNAATQIIINAFNKLMDETSVVREGEYIRSEQGQAVVARIQGAITRITEGGTNLTDADLRGLATEAKNVASALNAEREKELGNTRFAIEESLKAYNIPATRVFGNSEPGKAPAAPAGRIRVRNKATGQTGTISEGAFDPAKYEKL